MFYFRYRRPGGGKVERFKLGAFPELSLAQARAACDACGRRPRRPQPATGAPGGDRGADLQGAGRSLPGEPNKKLAARSLDEKRRALLIYAKPLHGLRLAEVTKAQLIALFDRVTAEHGPVQANRVARISRPSSPGR